MKIISEYESLLDEDIDAETFNQIKIDNIRTMITKNEEKLGKHNIEYANVLGTTGRGLKIFSSAAEMVDQLMLLISSKEAGNVSTEIDNEIVDILDHL